MNETVTKVKTILTWVVAILIVTVLIVPYILILLYKASEWNDKKWDEFVSKRDTWNRESPLWKSKLKNG